MFPGLKGLNMVLKKKFPDLKISPDFGWKPDFPDWKSLQNFPWFPWLVGTLYVEVNGLAAMWPPRGQQVLHQRWIFGNM